MTQSCGKCKYDFKILCMLLLRCDPEEMLRAGGYPERLNDGKNCPAFSPRPEKEKK